MSEKIRRLWAELYQGGIHEQIKNERSDRAVGLYSDYTPDGYLVTAGNDTY